MNSLVKMLTGWAPPPCSIAITGSGGKTSLLVALANEYAKMGCSVLLSTTTKLRHPNLFDYGSSDIHVDGSLPKPTAGEVSFFAQEDPDVSTKATAPDALLLASAATGFDVVLIEADGSRGLPLKYHRKTEPVIPPWVTQVIAVVGASALGRPLDGQVMHNYLLYRQACGDDDSYVTVRTFRHLLSLEGGIGSALVLCNQCEQLDASQVRQLQGLGMVCCSIQEDVVYGGET